MPRPECPVCGQFHEPTCADALAAWAGLAESDESVGGCPYNIRDSRTHRCSFCEPMLALDDPLADLEAMWRLPAREPGRKETL